MTTGAAPSKTAGGSGLESLPGRAPQPNISTSIGPPSPPADAAGLRRVALVHDWLVTWRGGEQILRRLATLFPRADLYTLIADPHKFPEELRRRPLHTSWLQRVAPRRYFRWALPLFPWTIEQFRFAGYDLIISVSHTVAKGIRPNGIPHLCYCLTPMRYAWVFPDLYFGRAARQLWSPQARMIQALRRWDARASERVTAFAAISRTVQTRIQQCYGRNSVVVHPPVACDLFARPPRVPRDYYLVVAALVPYKRTGLAIEACRRLRRPLVIVGMGPEARRLHRLAGPMTTFVGWQSPERLAEWYAGARALLYPQEEEFGIAALEAQAAGCPVIAYRQGSAPEVVLEGETGIFFDTQTPEALADAILRAEGMTWDPARLQRQARRFDQPVFDEALRRLAAAVVARSAR